MRPQDVLEEPHRKQPGAMIDVTLADGRTAATPALPLEMHGQRRGMRLDVPRAGEHGGGILAEIGCTADAIGKIAAPAGRGGIGRRAVRVSDLGWRLAPAYGGPSSGRGGMASRMTRGGRAISTAARPVEGSPPHSISGPVTSAITMLIPPA